MKLPVQLVFLVATAFGLPSNLVRQEDGWELGTNPLEDYGEAYLYGFIDTFIDVLDSGIASANAGDLSVDEMQDFSHTVSQSVASMFTMIQSCGTAGELGYSPLLFTTALLNVGLTEPFTGPIAGVLYDQMAVYFGNTEVADVLMGQVWPILEQLDAQVALECESSLEVIEDIPDIYYAQEKVYMLGGFIWSIYQSNPPIIPDCFRHLFFGLLMTYIDIGPGCADVDTINTIQEQVLKVATNFDLSEPATAALLTVDPNLLSNVDAGYRDIVEEMLAGTIGLYMKTMNETVGNFSESLEIGAIDTLIRTPMVFLDEFLAYLVVVGESEPQLSLLDESVTSSVSVPQVDTMSADELLAHITGFYQEQQSLMLGANADELVSNLVNSMQSVLSNVEGLDAEQLIRDILGSALLDLQGSLGSEEIQEIIDNEPALGQTPM